MQHSWKAKAQYSSAICSVPFHVQPFLWYADMHHSCKEKVQDRIHCIKAMFPEHPVNITMLFTHGKCPTQQHSNIVFFSMSNVPANIQDNCLDIWSPRFFCGTTWFLISTSCTLLKQLFPWVGRGYFPKCFLLLQGKSTLFQTDDYILE